MFNTSSNQTSFGSVGGGFTRGNCQSTRGGFSQGGFAARGSQRGGGPSVGLNGTTGDKNAGTSDFGDQPQNGEFFGARGTGFRGGQGFNRGNHSLGASRGGFNNDASLNGTSDFSQGNSSRGNFNNNGHGGFSHGGFAARGSQRGGGPSVGLNGTTGDKNAGTSDFGDQPQNGEFFGARGTGFRGGQGFNRGNHSLGASRGGFNGNTSFNGTVNSDQGNVFRGNFNQSNDVRFNNTDDHVGFSRGGFDTRGFQRGGGSGMNDSNGRPDNQQGYGHGTSGFGRQQECNGMFGTRGNGFRGGLHRGFNRGASRGGFTGNSSFNEATNSDQDTEKMFDNGKVGGRFGKDYAKNEDEIIIEGLEMGYTLAEIKTWREFGLLEQLIANVERERYPCPSKVQSSVIPLLLDGYDLQLLTEKTGSGSIATYLLPIIQKCFNEKRNQTYFPTPCVPYAVVLVHTHDLVNRCFEEAMKLTAGTLLTVARVYGEFSVRENVEEVEGTCDIVFATPGRFLRLVQRKDLVLHRVRFLIFEKGDILLSEDFKNTIDEALFHSGAPPIRMDRQTIFISANCDAVALEKSKEYMRKDKTVCLKNKTIAPSRSLFGTGDGFKNPAGGFGRGKTFGSDAGSKSGGFSGRALSGDGFKSVGFGAGKSSEFGAGFKSTGFGGGASSNTGVGFKAVGFGAGKLSGDGLRNPVGGFSCDSTLDEKRECFASPLKAAIPGEIGENVADSFSDDAIVTDTRESVACASDENIASNFTDAPGVDEIATQLPEANVYSKNDGETVDAGSDAAEEETRESVDHSSKAAMSDTTDGDAGAAKIEEPPRRRFITPLPADDILVKEEKEVADVSSSVNKKRRFISPHKDGTVDVKDGDAAGNFDSSVPVMKRQFIFDVKEKPAQPFVTPAEDGSVKEDDGNAAVGANDPKLKKITGDQTAAQDDDDEDDGW